MWWTRRYSCLPHGAARTRTDAHASRTPALASPRLQVCRDKQGAPKGYGFVIFSDTVAAELCVTVSKQAGKRVWRVRLALARLRRSLTTPYTRL